MPLNLQILTQEQVVSRGEADQVTIPTEDGEITVLPGHIPLFSKINVGQLAVKRNGKTEYLAVNGGFVDIGPKHVKVLADTAIRAEDINELKAKQAKEAAERALKEHESEQDFLQAQIALQRALLELNTLNKWRKLRNQ